MKRFLTAAALMAASLASGAARAEPFTIFVYETPADLALRTDPSPMGQAYWAEYARFADALQASGAIRGGAALQLPAQARIFKAGGAPVGAAGDGSLQLGGYFIIEAADLDAAAALAARAPSVSRGGAAEVRATYPAPTMAR